MSDFDFIDDIFCKVIDKKEKHGLTSLSREEEVVLLIWHASGILGNGGFQYFFEQELDAEAVAKACETIGFSKPAELFRLALSVFPNGLPHKNWDERIKFVQENEQMFGNLSNGFLETDKEMEKHLAKYIRGHLDKFSNSANVSGHVLERDSE